MGVLSEIGYGPTLVPEKTHVSAGGYENEYIFEDPYDALYE